MLIGLGQEAGPTSTPYAPPVDAKELYHAAVQTGDPAQIAAAEEAVRTQYAPQMRVGGELAAGDFAAAAAAVGVPLALVAAGVL